MAPAGPACDHHAMSATPGLPEGYEFSAAPARVDADRAHGWWSTDAYWAQGRPRETHERAMASGYSVRRIGAQGVHEKLGFRPPARPGEHVVHHLR